jgi:hypothetical protein
MKRLITTFNIFLLAALSSSFAFAEDTDGMHEGCTRQHPMWLCGRCVSPDANWPPHMQCVISNDNMHTTMGVLMCEDVPCNQAQIDATWAGCGPAASTAMSCYGKPVNPPQGIHVIPPPTDKCMGMGCNPDTWSPTPVN